MISFKSLNYNALTWHHHHPYGMMMPDRDWSSESGYRFGVNGKETDLETDLSFYNYGMRMYNAGLARFLSIDPLMDSYPHLSTYQYCSLNPIIGIDLDGEELLKIHTSMYRMKYLGSDSWLKEANIDYIIEVVEENIPDNYINNSPEWLPAADGSDVLYTGPILRKDGSVYSVAQDDPSFSPQTYGTQTDKKAGQLIIHKGLNQDTLCLKRVHLRLSIIYM